MPTNNSEKITQWIHPCGLIRREDLNKSGKYMKRGKSPYGSTKVFFTHTNNEFKEEFRLEPELAELIQELSEKDPFMGYRLTVRVMGKQCRHLDQAEFLAKGLGDADLMNV